MIGKNIVILFFLGICSSLESKLTPIVQTTKGPIQGEILKTVVKSVQYSSFKGIPYAKPPLGYLRFKPPVEIESWTNVLQTTIEGANCIQKDFVYETNYTGSEDCLYLNVYSPKVDFQNDGNNLLPVMVWIYGGSFKSGYSNSSLYGPDFIIEEGVVLVTFNYRLGPFGFLNVNHENATGNAALKDQNLVLRWVQKNIAKFGGNPNNVTIFGQSAGGVAVDLHGLSEMSKGLFHRSIAMSASPLVPWGFHKPGEAKERAFTLGEKLGKRTTSVNKLLRFLYNASALEIMEKTEEMGGIDPPFKPSIEDAKVAVDQEKFLTVCPFWKYVSGNFNKVPHLTGFTSEETLRFAGSAEKIVDMVNVATNYLKLLPKKSSLSLPITSTVLSTVADGVDKLSLSVIEGLINETSDLLFVPGIDLKQKLLHAHSGQPVYYYRFSYSTPQSLHKILYNIDFNGAAHGDDFGYIFHMTVADLPLNPKDLTYITRRRMTRLWTNFAKYSNPTPDGKKEPLLQGITWPDVGSRSRYLEFNNDLAVGENPASITADLASTASLAVLPVHTGCVSGILHKLSNLNPFNKIKNIGNGIVDKIPVIG